MFPLRFSTPHTVFDSAHKDQLISIVFKSRGKQALGKVLTFAVGLLLWVFIYTFSAWSGQNIFFLFNLLRVFCWFAFLVMLWLIEVLEKWPPNIISTYLLNIVFTDTLFLSSLLVSKMYVLQWEKLCSVFLYILLF